MLKSINRFLTNGKNLISHSESGNIQMTQQDPHHLDIRYFGMFCVIIVYYFSYYYTGRTNT